MKNFKKLARQFKVLSDPNRLKILHLLSSGEKCVCHIEGALGLDQNLVSHHLKVLKNEGFINVCKCGKWRHYSLNKKSILCLNTLRIISRTTC
ncbi:MAG: Arsenical resistance operon repressor [uncultured bacterium]|nr:MAG: Arsenical resistance operon repressor [uncultured bacterium]HAU40333.1 transcriptional regulator [Candidatus Peregrinibacteria bacterium]